MVLIIALYHGVVGAVVSLLSFLPHRHFYAWFACFYLFIIFFSFLPYCSSLIGCCDHAYYSHHIQSSSLPT